MSGAWQPGDRVQVLLSVRRGDRLRPSRSWVPGTVREINPPGLPPGVRVDLDYPVHGVPGCYATHSELQRIESAPVVRQPSPALDGRAPGGEK